MAVCRLLWALGLFCSSASLHTTLHAISHSMHAIQSIYRRCAGLVPRLSSLQTTPTANSWVSVLTSWRSCSVVYCYYGRPLCDQLSQFIEILQGLQCSSGSPWQIVIRTLQSVYRYCTGLQCSLASFKTMLNEISRSMRPYLFNAFSRPPRCCSFMSFRIWSLRNKRL